MGFNCGIVGLPNVGTSTLFNALTATAAASLTKATTLRGDPISTAHFHLPLRRRRPLQVRRSSKPPKQALCQQRPPLPPSSGGHPGCSSATIPFYGGMWTLPWHCRTPQPTLGLVSSNLKFFLLQTCIPLTTINRSRSRLSISPLTN